MNKRTKTILTVVMIGTFIVVIYLKLSNNKKELDEKIYHPAVNTAVQVQADTIRPTKFEQNIPFTGSFIPNREVIIGAEASGKVIQVGVQEGEAIHTGHLIAQLDKGVLEAQLLSAQANYSKAVSTLSRYQHAASGVTQLQMDNAKTDIQTTEAQIRQLKEQIAQYTILSPFSGIVTSRNFDLGAIVSPGYQMATLSDISYLKLQVSVPEKNITAFKTGQSVNISTDVYPGKLFPGKVNMVASKADASHNFTVELLIPNPNAELKAGMYGTITLDNSLSNDALTVPRSALTGSSTNPQVYVIKNGVANLRTITIGPGNEVRVQVTNGLKSGEVIVASGLVNLHDGSNVNTSN
ncbi:efflux RND transporter periplasmic adaptor subunit [Chitinophaga sancti]|uniref:efflux RND transporter periplasmic adaptor subunit n=1 Tax=Chitinophaga sancti TaxID=1004 RepID=UPI002A7640DE|nr:efflux RND transporter periplasmic adaptor subunit [Chitinophaga sancti]WPQ62030.1 efflux RND transporter periplasmic adaptor subunit [Chitinophaga sancti]